ncbi:unnamed protein product [Rhodiola kirilowii]
MNLSQLRRFILVHMNLFVLLPCMTHLGLHYLVDLLGKRGVPGKGKGVRLGNAPNLLLTTDG